MYQLKTFKWTCPVFDIIVAINTFGQCLFFFPWHLHAEEPLDWLWFQITENTGGYQLCTDFLKNVIEFNWILFITFFLASQTTSYNVLVSYKECLLQLLRDDESPQAVTVTQKKHDKWFQEGVSRSSVFLFVGKCQCFKPDVGS